MMQMCSGDFVLIVEDREESLSANNGRVAQIFGQALCCMYHNYFTNPKPGGTRPPKLHALRLHKHFAAFFTLHATEAQVDAVCRHKKLAATFTKMTLEVATL
ncbi:Hypothetical protein, putative [Bodo saltans]|uniref:Uncharacterized protein n=1 Tax=Bodo saltans TaxID=75058 RepID=A0A0S4IZ42_BODSA|nr:Hypothetical protein, putative [Bodo saltans]|eukprot:CUG16718.1 Hypothetical protein, putative [Bodo saltans]